MFLQRLRVGEEDGILLLLAVSKRHNFPILRAIADGAAVRRIAYHLKGRGNRHECPCRAKGVNVTALFRILGLLVQEGNQADIEAQHLGLREKVTEVILNGAAPADVHNRDFFFRTA